MQQSSQPKSLVQHLHQQQQQQSRGLAFIPRGVTGSGAPIEPPIPQGGVGGGGGGGHQRTQNGGSNAGGGGGGGSNGGGGVDGGEKRKRRPRKKRAKISTAGPAGNSSAVGSDDIDGGLEDEGDDLEIEDAPHPSSSSSSSSIVDARRKIPFPIANALSGVGSGKSFPLPALPPHAAGTASTSSAGGSNNVSGTSGMDSRFISSLSWTDPAMATLVPTTGKALHEVFKFTHLSIVQAATLPKLCKGEDVFGKAKTGGGKTLSYLIPAVERLSLMAKGGKGGSGGGHRIGCLVISPTRELALQILEEAKNLCRFHPTFKVMAVIGGTNINSEKNRMASGSGQLQCDIVVGTPGRIVDHIENTSGFATALGQTQVLVLDEADRLLDMGFKAALDKIGSCIPPNHGPGLVRQNMLFSATVPPEVLDVAKRFLRPGYSLVDTVSGDEPNTNVNVKQELMVLPSQSILPALARILSHAALADPTHKVIVFFPTARTTGFFAGIFERMKVIGAQKGQKDTFNIIEMHSRKSQGYRTSAADKFRVGKGVMMFSSDVSARGMDYPDVTFVVQVGLTDREQYIHRIGRTARAGKKGAGLLILADYEAPALLPDLSDLPIEVSGPRSILTGGAPCGVPGVDGGLGGEGGALSGGKWNVAPAVVLPMEVGAVLATVERDDELKKECEQSYQGWLGFYKGFLKKMRMDPASLVAECNRLYASFGLKEPPVIGRDVLGKMGLRGVVGIREGPGKSQGGRGGGGGGGGGGGRGVGGGGGGGGFRGGGGGGGGGGGFRGGGGGGGPQLR